jgi:hypothetical protein
MNKSNRLAHARYSILIMTRAHTYVCHNSQMMEEESGRDKEE